MQKIFEKNPDFVQREIAGEFLLIPIRRTLAESNAIYVLNETSAAMWKRLDGTRNIRQIQEDLLSEFEVPAEELERDVSTLLSDLLSICAIVEKS